MATFKIACPDCGQKVSGDESFLGTVVDCPLCGTKIKFPKEVPPEPAAKDTKKPESESAEPTPKPKEKEKPKKKESAAPKSASAPEDSSKREIPAAPEPAAAPAKSPSAPPANAPVLTPAAGAAAPASRSSKPRRTSSAAVWSMIFGIAAVIFCPVGILFAIPAIIAGHSGRSSVLNSIGKVGGQGFATTGLALGYTYVALFLAAFLFVPWKALISMAEQGENKRSATTLLVALSSHATAADGALPAQLADLVPGSLSAEEFEKYKYIEPGSLPPERFEFTYYPCFTMDDDPRTILISAPDADRSYQRLVGYLDGSVEIIGEEDFIRQEMKQKR